jgi:hypothetical protein
MRLIEADFGTPPGTGAHSVALEIDGVPVVTAEGTSILRAASEAGIPIPRLCATDSLRAFLRVIGLPLGMPLELVLLDWSQTNYSSARAALEQAWVGFRAWQSILVEQFLAPVLAWQLERWVTDRKLPAPPEGLAGVKSSWIAPSFPWLDQLKEAQAWASKLDRGMETHARSIKSLGLDPDQVLEQREKEIRQAITRAQSIEKATGEAVPWTVFCGLAAKGAEAPNGKPGTPNPPAMPQEDEA